MERENVAENTSCQMSAANWSTLAVSDFIARETTSPTPKNQLGNCIIAHKTWKVDMDFKRQESKATTQSKIGILF